MLPLPSYSLSHASLLPTSPTPHSCTHTSLPPSSLTTHPHFPTPSHHPHLPSPSSLTSPTSPPSSLTTRGGGDVGDVREEGKGRCVCERGKGGKNRREDACEEGWGGEERECAQKKGGMNTLYSRCLIIMGRAWVNSRVHGTQTNSVHQPELSLCHLCMKLYHHHF